MIVQNPVNTILKTSAIHSLSNELSQVHFI